MSDQISVAKVRANAQREADKFLRAVFGTDHRDPVTIAECREEIDILKRQNGNNLAANLRIAWLYARIKRMQRHSVNRAMSAAERFMNALEDKRVDRKVSPNRKHNIRRSNSVGLAGR